MLVMYIDFPPPVKAIKAYLKKFGLYMQIEDDDAMNGKDRRYWTLLGVKLEA